MPHPKTLSERKQKKEVTSQLEEIKGKLIDREWRLNNLYWIKDDQGNHIQFKLNNVQKHLYNNLWYLNVILKARQHGITTFFCLLFLDDTLFGMKDSAIIAHTLFDAQKIFDSKIRYAWNNFPEWLRNEYELNQDNVRTLKFKRGQQEASIYVGTSLRGGTNQNLHITELGTIDQREPDKSNEIKTGALNTVHQGQIVVIESTSKGQYGNFYDICKTSINLDKDIKAETKELTTLDYKFFFFPWFIKDEYKVESKGIITNETREYFNHLKAITDYNFNREQMMWYQKKKEIQKDAMRSEFPSTPDEAFQANIEGSYYGKQIDQLREKKQIRIVPYDPRILVDTYWDLGISDVTSVIFVQRSAFEIRVFDYYENSGEGITHYVKMLTEKGYVYGNHYAPHDIEVRELGTGKSRREISASLGVNFSVVPQHRIEDGIEAVRTLIPRCWFDEEKCDRLLKALAEYRKEWDDKLGTFKERPLHNWASHPADAFRMLAMTAEEVKDLQNQLDPEEIEMMKAKERSSFNPFNPLSDL